MPVRRLLWALTLLPALIAVASQPTDAKPRKLALKTVEGVVASIDEHKGEGDLETLAVELTLSESQETRVVLLAPPESCREIGFEIEVGDRIRARIFVDAEGPAKAHKALNLTRGTMVRFRTLRSVPLWTASGAWQGGPRQTQPGARRGPGRTGSAPGPGPGGGGR